MAVVAAAPVATALVTSATIAGATALTGIIAAVALFVVVVVFVVLRRCAMWERFPNSLRSVWMAPVAAFLVYFAFGIADIFLPVVFPRTIGAFAILATFMGAFSVIAGGLLLHYRVLATVATYSAVAAIFFGSNNHEIPQSKAAAPTFEEQNAFSQWLLSRRDLGDYRALKLAYPVILVSSEGGGIYATAHAYGLLSTIANHCPTFDQHVFAMVGVSGGAIGNALFAATTDIAQKPYQPCGPSGRPVDPTPVVIDHLSPVLARLLLIEPLDRWLPGRWVQRDRAQILTDSFLSVAPEPNYLQTAISDGYDPKSSRPAVISVTLDVSDGRRLVIAPFQPEQYVGTAQWWPQDNDDFDGVQRKPQVSLLDAASASARFPWLTPTGRLHVSDKSEITLADGGYFDNSGAETVLDIITDLRLRENQQNAGTLDDSEPRSSRTKRQPCDKPKIRLVKNFGGDRTAWKYCEIPIFIIHLALASEEPSEEEQGPEGAADMPKAAPLIQSQSFLFDPIKALLATRSSRAEIALARSDLELCDMAIPGAECLLFPGSSMGFFRVNIAPIAWRLPLGWYMPRQDFQTIIDQTGPNWIFDYRARKEEAQTELEMFLFHLDVGLFKEGADPSYSDVAMGP
ncbi:patatin-like phospholipase family protein [Mesorhizobium sp. M2D.F.Ca.ET.223.01.1.1]|nr:patatin-like phospholipase family protein [Mesorhizobium sp. M2D.F.Ca.ET.223.01.1.1]